MQQKTANLFFPTQSQLALALDDNCQPWMNKNGVFSGLIQIRPYVFWHFEPNSYPDSIFKDMVNDNTLERMTVILKDIHDQYYNQEIDIKYPPFAYLTLIEYKHQIFKDLHICVSPEINGHEMLIEKIMYYS